MLRFLKLVCLLSVALGPWSTVGYEFDDLEAEPNHNFTCPLSVLCSLVCVADLADCANSCPVGTTRCQDGSCSEDCIASDNNLNPCPSCSPIACPRLYINSDDCQKQPTIPACEAEKAAESGINAKPLSILLLSWIAVAFVCFGWISFCNRGGEMHDLGDGLYATGFSTRSWLGKAIYALVVLTLVVFQLILLGFAIASYAGNEVYQKQVLRAFEVTWALGFFWALLFKWPPSIQSLFWLKCSFTQANMVGVSYNMTSGAVPLSGESYIVALQVIGSTISAYLHKCLGCMFRLPHGRLDYCPIHTDPGSGTRYFVHQLRRFNLTGQTFTPARMGVASTLGQIREGLAGLSNQQVRERLRIVGPNAIQMPKPSFPSILLREFSKPFYTYQNFMLWTWVPLYYYYLSIVHGSVIIAGGVAVAWFQYKSEVQLHKLTHVEGQATVFRDNQFQEISQEHLVPGDLVAVQPGKTYCDMVLVKSSDSRRVLVDESALTGESTPMAKTPVDTAAPAQTAYDKLAHKKHTFMAGTTIIESDDGMNDLAIVTNTGSFTSKGELLHQVFTYERQQFKFDVEVGFVIFILVIESIIGFTIEILLIRENPVYAWFYGMHVVTTLLPPLLPTVFTVSTGISHNRLTRNHIACTNAEDILVAGKVTRAFFDKTGTLTRAGLDFISARCRDSWNNEEEVDLQFLSKDLRSAMSCCHGLTMASSGDIIGNPVDRTMFEASGASFGSRGNDVILDGNGQEIEVVKRFDFSHHTMTMSVIARLPNGLFMAYVKGSGESMRNLCNAASLPPDFDAAVKNAAKAGTYQISVGSKPLESTTDVVNITREEVESNLSFTGVINFKNVLREESPDVIAKLEAGEVKCVMVTGDNMFTGVTIAKEAGMIRKGVKLLLCSGVDRDGGRFSLQWKDEDGKNQELPSTEELRTGTSGIELAITGDVWDSLLEMDRVVAGDLAHYICVYGRCTPLQKVSVVSNFVEQGFVTAMVGDGGNDCGALKTAHVGVALSDAEASIVSPFTSLEKSIDSVVEIIKEGRCALASGLASYKYIIMYGQIEAFANILMAYYRINLSEYAWVFMDGFWVICMSFSLPLSKAASKLAETRPTASLLGPHTVSSTCGILVLNFTFTLLGLVALNNQDWYQCRRWKNEDISNLAIIGDNYESEVIFLVSGYQYISTALAYNFGYEFRESWTRNFWLLSLAGIFTLMHFWVTLVAGKLSCFWRVNCVNEDVVYSLTLGEYYPIQNEFATTLMPFDFRVVLLVLIIVNTLANLGWDYFVVNGTRKRLAARKRQKKAVMVATKFDIGVV